MGNTTTNIINNKTTITNTTTNTTTNTVKDLITENKKYNTITKTLKFNNYILDGKNTYNVKIIQKHDNKIIDLITNFLFVIELKNENIEINVNKIFDKISLEIAGISILRLYKHQIPILQSFYGLEVKRVGNKIYYPIPFECGLNGNGILVPYLYDTYIIQFYFNFINEYNENISNIELNYDCLFVEGNLLNNNLTNIKLVHNGELYQPDLTSKQINTIHNNSNTKIMHIKCYKTNGELYKKCIISRLVDYEYTGEDIITNIHVKSSKFYLYFNKVIKRLFFYFEYDTNIYENKIFNSIKFIADGLEVFNLNYDDIINNKYNVPSGVYVIDMLKYLDIAAYKHYIEFDGLNIPFENIKFQVFTESINYIKYDDNDIHDSFQLFFRN